MLVNEGLRDGRSGKHVLSVDGFQFYPYHADMIKKFQDVIDM